MDQKQTLARSGLQKKLNMDLVRGTPSKVFFLGILVGMFTFWILDARRFSEKLMVRDLDHLDHSVLPQNFHNDPETGHHEGEDVLAADLAKRIRIFVFILTSPQNKISKAIPVKTTWARRFDGYIFVSSENDKDLPSISAVEAEGRKYLWAKTRSGFIHAYHVELNNYEYFMKADDDTFVIVENLRYILAEKNPNEPFLMGRRFKQFVKQGYTSGGAGYVLSRAALKLIAEGMINETKACMKRYGAEDVNLGECAEAVGVKLIDSLDEHQQEVFHPFAPAAMLNKARMDKISWIHSYNYFPVKTGLDCCSDHTVSFHYISPSEMYVLEFLVYHIYPYGITRDVNQYEKVKHYRRSNAFLFLLGLMAGFITVRMLNNHRFSHFNLSEHFEVTELESFQIGQGHHYTNTLLADELAKKVRVYALILTMPASKLTKAVHVKATWARRFNGYVFISSENDTSLPSIRAVEKENRGVLWEKTRQAFMYAKKNLINEYDFFMKADDDSYVIVENLRFILSKMDPNKPFIMGRRFKKFVKQGYLSGGAGYVVSRAALKLIAEGMEKEASSCRKRGGAEDVNLGACAEEVGVKMVDSLDEHGEEAFHPFNPSYMLDKKAMEHTEWVHFYNYYPIRTGLDCCSDHSVSFHYISPQDMYILDYLIYHAYPYGIARDLEQYKELERLKQGEPLIKNSPVSAGKPVPNQL
nr:glycoprotein N acetylgalactosamine [Hymenolepis microstoma]